MSSQSHVYKITAIRQISRKLDEKKIIKLSALPGRRHTLGKVLLPRSHVYVRVNTISKFKDVL